MVGGVGYNAMTCNHIFYFHYSHNFWLNKNILLKTYFKVGGGGLKGLSPRFCRVVPDIRPLFLPL